MNNYDLTKNNILSNKKSRTLKSFQKHMLFDSLSGYLSQHALPTGSAKSISNNIYSKTFCTNTGGCDRCGSKLLDPFNKNNGLCKKCSEDMERLYNKGYMDLNKKESQIRMKSPKNEWWYNLDKVLLRINESDEFSML